MSVKAILYEQKSSGSSSMVLQNIAITTPPTKTVYNALEVFNPTGMVVTATWLVNGVQTVTG